MPATTSGLPTLTAAQLTPVVRASLGRADIQVDAWHCRPLSATSSSSAGVFLVHGTARDTAGTATWSLILKTVHSGAIGPNPLLSASLDPGHSSYWKRELNLYRSGLFDDLPSGLAVPTCFHIEVEDDEYWLWLEPVHDEYGERWPVARYGIAARHLGQLNGLYLTEREVPEWGWLLTDGMRQRERLAEESGLWDDFEAIWQQNEVVRRGWTHQVARDMQRIWRERELFFEAMESLPRVVSHNDSSRKNLMSRRTESGESQTVALDWAMAGTGALGEELAPLVVSSVLWFSQPAEHIRAMSEVAFDGYLQGLRDAGWHGDPASARLGYTAAVALRFGPLLPVMELLPISDQSLEAMFGHSKDEIIDNCARWRPFVIECADEARLLMDEAGAA